MASLLLVLTFLYSVHEGFLSNCPPEEGLLLLNSALLFPFHFIGIYLTYQEDCYPNGSYFWDSNIDSVTDEENLSCVLPGTNLTTGQWVRVHGDEPVDCNNSSDSYPFRCTNDTSPDATISLYLTQARALPTDQEGFYKCCLPTDCSSTNETIYANVFSKIMISK